MTAFDVPSGGPELKAFIQGACLRCDREALRAAMQSVAEDAGITKQRALAALVDWMLREKLREDDDHIPVDALETIPTETLEGITFNLARLMYAYSPPPSRAS